MKSALGLFFVSMIASTSVHADAVKPMDVAFVDGTVEASLTGVEGDATVGRNVFSNRKQGNCLACHVNKEMTGARRCCRPLDPSGTPGHRHELEDDV